MQQSAIYHERHELAPEIVEGLRTEFNRLHEVLAKIDRLTRQAEDETVTGWASEMAFNALLPVRRIRRRLQIPY